MRKRIYICYPVNGICAIFTLIVKLVTLLLHMDIQKQLFEVIRTKIDPALSPGEVIRDILDINIDAAYRRLRGETQLSPQEMGMLCRYFNISMDRILHINGREVVFDYNPMDPARLDKYDGYISDFAEIFSRLAASPQKQILTLAHDIPLYHLMAYPEMSFFKLYAWHQSIYREHFTYEAFVAGMDTDRIMEYHSNVADSVRQVPSTEIWTMETLNPSINLIDFFFDINAFENKEIPLLLCCQLLSVIDNLELWSEKGYIEFKGQQTPFNLYGCPLKMCPNFTVVNSNGIKWGFMHLYGTQYMSTSSHVFCMEIEKLLENILIKSLYINGASSRERHRLFRQQRNMIETLMQKINFTNL